MRKRVVSQANARSGDCRTAFASGVIFRQIMPSVSGDSGDYLFRRFATEL